MKNSKPNNDSNKDNSKNNLPSKKDYKLKADKVHSPFVQWWINLFVGYWYGLTDMFLASWINVVVLAIITLVPLIYGIISSLAYWNPMNSLGNMKIGFFDEDKTFIKVQQLDTSNANGDPAKYIYHVGAFDGIYDDATGKVAPISQPEIDAFMSKGTMPSEIKPKVRLHLNNGFVVTYDPSTVQLTPMNTWDTMKQTSLTKEEPSKDDHKSYFRVSFAPDPRLNFKKIKYISDSNTIDDDWQTGKYLAQVKIGDGYGMAQTGKTGIALDSDYQTPYLVNGNVVALKMPGTNNVIPKAFVTEELAKGDFGYFDPTGDADAINANKKNWPAIGNYLKSIQSMDSKNLINKGATVQSWATFENNFISAYLLHSLMHSSDSIMEKSAPLLNALSDNFTANSTFGTKGIDIINALKNSNLKNEKEFEALFNSTQYYMILDQTTFEQGLGGITINDSSFASKTMFGKGGDNQTDNSNGTVGTWVREYQHFINTDQYKALFSESANNINFLNEFLQNLSGSTAPNISFDKEAQMSANAIKELITVPNATAANVNGTDDAKAFIAAYLKTMGPAIAASTPNGALPEVSEFQNIAAFYKTASDGGKGTLLPYIPCPTSNVPGANDGTTNLFQLFTGMLQIPGNFDKFFPYMSTVAQQIMEGDTTGKTTLKDAEGQITVNMIGDVYTQMNITKAINGSNPNDLNIMLPARGGNKVIYGIGIGTMMIYAGFYVGFSVLRAVIKRNKQYSKLVASNWYISKFLQYLTVGFVQITLSVWIIYGAAWHKYVSPSGMALDYLWMLEGGVVIMSIILGLNYAIQPGIGSILAIIYLAFNVTTGGGSYPGWMETGFFHVVSWLTPYKYAISGSQQIIFGIDIGGANKAATDYMLQCWGFLTCFFVFFFGIGFMGARRNMRQAMYGTAKAKNVYNALVYLDRSKELQTFRTAKTNRHGETKINRKNQPKYKYDWKALNPVSDLEIAEVNKKLVGRKLVFKWYAKSRVARHSDDLEQIDKFTNGE